MFERVGILYAAVEVTAELERLQRATAEAVRASGLVVEDRPYRPHVTLARSKGAAGIRTLKRLRPALEQQRLRVGWIATEFLLYESQPTPTGSRYVVRARFGLGTAGGMGGEQE
jgi:2'-5' RNA ligase